MLICIREIFVSSLKRGKKAKDKLFLKMLTLSVFHSNGKAPDGLLGDTNELCNWFLNNDPRGIGFCPAVLLKWSNTHPIPKGNKQSMGSYGDCVSLDVDPDLFDSTKFSGKYCQLTLAGTRDQTAPKAVKQYQTTPEILRGGAYWMEDIFKASPEVSSLKYNWSV
jgi:hypothetical protein